MRGPISTTVKIVVFFTTSDEPTMSNKLEEVYDEKAIFLSFVNYLICICKQNLC